MNDPTRIDRVLAALKDAWEGQPELPLATLFAQLSNAGYGWGTSDEHLVSALREMAACHPPQFPPAAAPAVTGVWFLCCQNPGSKERWRVTVDAHTAVVQYFSPGKATQPVVWCYQSIRSTGPWRPLVITDEEGFEHRLGIIEGISRLDIPALRVEALSGDLPPAPAVAPAPSPAPAPGSSRLTPKLLGEYEYVIRCESSTLRLGARLDVFEKKRRELSTRRISWRALVTCQVGKPFVFVDDSATEVTLGTVSDILIVQAPSRRMDGLDA